jgi:Uma2 family endonuclease
MNTHLRPPALPLTTDAAEGLPRRRWTVAEIEAMVEAGVVREDERFELIGGEVVPMSPKGILHETLKLALAHYWFQRLPDHLRLGTETAFRLSVDTFVEPDFVFYPTAIGLANLTPATCLFAVEVADTSLAFDSGRKLALYASFGVPEVWVIDARTRDTRVSRAPSPDGYGETRLYRLGETIPVAISPGLSVDMTALPSV